MRSLLVFCLLSPTTALACGGLFCNNAATIQSAERILFGPGERAGTVQMHVQITWSGPRDEFGWLLPVPPDVETGISTPRIFGGLDAFYTPSFRLRRDCGSDQGVGGMGGAGGMGGEGGGGGGGVMVLQRAEVGPYDQVVLRAEDAGEVVDWLDENGFNAPRDADALLQSYLDNGSAMLALKLLPEEGINNIAPLWLEFTADQPTIPIRPTGLAAQPDMGIIVHLFGPARAVPTNYLHVTINDAAIDWFAARPNYTDVVSQAVDEAGGLAFTTDFAGPIDRDLWQPFWFAVYEDGHLADLRAAETFGAVNRVISRVEGGMTPEVAALLEPLVEPPDGWTFDDMRTFPWENREVPVDGAALAAAIEAEVNGSRKRVRRLFADNNWVTRLYTTMSPDEMRLDPIFDYNPDLEPVSQLREARFQGQGPRNCDDGVLTLEDGREYVIRDRERGGRVIRQNGVTVRGSLTPAAARVERHFPVGQPEMLAQMPEQPSDPIALTPAGQDSEAGCGGCDTQNTAPTLPLLLLGLLALRARRLSP